MGTRVRMLTIPGLSPTLPRQSEKPEVVLAEAFMRPPTTKGSILWLECERRWVHESSERIPVEAIGGSAQRALIASSPWVSGRKYATRDDLVVAKHKYVLLGSGLFAHGVFVVDCDGDDIAFVPLGVDLANCRIERSLSRPDERSYRLAPTARSWSVRALGL